MSNEKMITDALIDIETEANYMELGLPMNEEDVKALRDAVATIKQHLVLRA